jgi:hypothetical protein
MTPLTAEKIAELERLLAEAYDWPPSNLERFTEAVQEHMPAILSLAKRVAGAPVAIMDTRDALGICAPTEEDFPALYALQGKRVLLVEIVEE